MTKTEMFNVKEPEHCIALFKEVVEILHEFLKKDCCLFFPTKNVKISGLLLLYKDDRIFRNRKQRANGKYIFVISQY